MLMQCWATLRRGSSMINTEINPQPRMHPNSLATVAMDTTETSTETSRQIFPQKSSLTFSSGEGFPQVSVFFFLHTQSEVQTKESYSLKLSLWEKLNHLNHNFMKAQQFMSDNGWKPFNFMALEIFCNKTICSHRNDDFLYIIFCCSTVFLSIYWVWKCRFCKNICFFFVSLQEISTCTQTKEPPTLSSISLVVDVLMRGARRWWRTTRVRSVTHKQ